MSNVDMPDFESGVSLEVGTDLESLKSSLFDGTDREPVFGILVVSEWLKLEVEVGAMTWASAEEPPTTRDLDPTQPELIFDAWLISVHEFNASAEKYILADEGDDPVHLRIYVQRTPGGGFKSGSASLAPERSLLLLS